MRTIKTLLPSIALGLILVAPSAALACPNCKEAVANQTGTDTTSNDVVGVRNGFSWSILMMIGTPLGMVGTGIFVVARAVKRGILPEM